MTSQNVAVLTISSRNHWRLLVVENGYVLSIKWRNFLTDENFYPVFNKITILVTSSSLQDTNNVQAVFIQWSLNFTTKT